MKHEKERQFSTHVLKNIIYSATIALVVNIFLNINLNILATSEYKKILFNDKGNPSIFWMIIYDVTAILIFSLIFFFLQRNTLLSIEKMSEVVQKISDGQLDARVENDEDNEFSLMAKNLNRMAEKISLLINQEREIKKTKDDLITNVAHDLKTPLTSIIGYVDVLIHKSIASEEDKQRYLQIVYEKSKYLEQLIEDLFGFTKTENGQVNLTLGQIDIVELMEQILSEFIPNLEENHLSYEIESNIESKIIEADGHLLSRLFSNLLNNAIKYGKEGKKLILHIEGQEDFVKVSVINFGDIIPEDKLGRIFEKFYRLEESRNSSVSGTGLGLAIVKNIVDMHGGKIEVKSNYLEGTVFCVRFNTKISLVTD
ncbi:hypothetical protein FACS189418_4610 [Clostridia bacterium]|nr:hypothetical protein FACS189418_4610 [Clostridia bacterium]